VELSRGESFSGLTLTTSDALAPGSYPFTAIGTTMSADGTTSTKQLEVMLSVAAGFTLATLPPPASKPEAT
jgi:hypothetical protein